MSVCLLSRSFNILFLFSIYAPVANFYMLDIWFNVKARFTRLVNFNIQFLGNCLSISPNIKSNSGTLFALKQFLISYRTFLDNIFSVSECISSVTSSSSL